MKVNEYLNTSSAELQAAGIATARLDCLVLMEDVLNTNRTQILAHPDREFTEVEKQKLDTMIHGRSQHIPLAYIRGKTEFYGREFSLNEHVLEPRPESETMINMLKSAQTDSSRTIIDIGTGSGALAITAALECKDAIVLATDIDPHCLKLAKANTARLSANVTYFEGDLLEALPATIRRQPATLLCNLPYVPDNFQINRAATHEPRLAIFGGVDGLDLFGRLFDQLLQNFPGETLVLCESLPPQHSQLAAIAKAAGFQSVAEHDFIQLFQRIDTHPAQHR